MPRSSHPAPHAAPAPGPLDTHHLQTAVGRRLLRGSSTVLLAQAAKLVLQVSSTILLARLLAPEAFGLFAMVAAFAGLLGLFLGLGLTPAIVQCEQLTQRQLSTLFWLNLGAGLALMLLLIGLGPLLAGVYGEPRLPAITAAAALAFPLAGAVATQRALLTRQMHIDWLVGIDLASLALALLLAVGMAWGGAGVWSLVLMGPLQALLQLLALWRVCPWRPGPPARGTGVRPLLRFGGDLLGVAVVGHLVRQLDKVAIGIVYGPAALGHYSRAYQVYLLPTSQLLTPLYDVVLPTLSRLVGARGRFVTLFAASLAALTWIAAALALALFLHPGEIVRVVLGAQWEQAVPVLHNLAPAVAAQPLLSAAGWALTSLGEGRRYWRLAWVTALWQCALLLLALPFGPAGVALSLSLSSWCVAVPLALRGLAGSRLRLFWPAVAAVAPPVLLAGTVLVLR